MVVGKNKNRGAINVTLEEYLKHHHLKLSTFAKTYNLDYHKLFRVKQGAVTRDKAIQQVFEQLNIMNIRKHKIAEPNSSFMAQERVCINYEPTGDIYCYYLHQLKEIEAYLIKEGIPHYVRAFKDCWLVKYDKEAGI